VYLCAQGAAFFSLRTNAAAAAAAIRSFYVRKKKKKREMVTGSCVSLVTQAFSPALNVTFFVL
jgi:hypothetical protein